MTEKIKCEKCGQKFAPQGYPAHSKACTGRVTCQHCGKHEIYAKDLCRNCYHRNLRNGKPERLVSRLEDSDILEAAVDIMNYGRRISDVAEETGIAPQTLANSLSGRTKQGRRVRQYLPTTKLDFALKEQGEFSTNDVARIRAAARRGATYSELAKKRGVGIPTISKLARGISYSWLNELCKPVEEKRGCSEGSEPIHQPPTPRPDSTPAVLRKTIPVEPLEAAVKAVCPHCECAQTLVVYVEGKPVGGRSRECQWCGDVVAPGAWEATGE